MHAIKDRPVVVDGQIVVRPIMVVALTYDHRLLDGREAVTFLGTSSSSPLFCSSTERRWLVPVLAVKVRDYLEDPRKMLLTA